MFTVQMVGFQKAVLLTKIFLLFFQPCMKKTDKVSGLITRNCAPFEQNTDRCILDKRGNEVCYCFENLCNVSAPSSVIVNHYTAIMVLSLATSYYYR